MQEHNGTMIQFRLGIVAFFSFSFLFFTGVCGLEAGLEAETEIVAAAHRHSRQGSAVVLLYEAVCLR